MTFLTTSNPTPNLTPKHHFKTNDMKLYFSRFNEEIAYSKEWILKEMKERELEYLEVYEAKRELGTSYFFCKAVGLVAEHGDGFDDCGKSCELYAPRNGRSGCCKYRGFCYEPGQEYILKNNGELIKRMPEYDNNDLINFAIYLTGHDKETIEQMYKDWKK